MVRNFHVQADGTAVCPHRDLSVCPSCAADENIVEVAGAHYFIEDPSERDDLRAVLAEEVGLSFCGRCGREVRDDAPSCRCSSGPAGPRHMELVR